MATITTDEYLDDAPRTSGENWSCDGGILKIRTDTRVHANSPTLMTGSLGNVAVSSSLGGGYRIENDKVRVLSFDTGSGNVPAIGTTINQGGVTGYLLGVYADWSSSPSTVGYPMPSNGFLKFREVVGGSFVSGALGAIGAFANDIDKVGWLEIVHDQDSNITIPRLSTGFTITQEKWFDLGLTSGVRGQIIQTPTNGGGGYIPAVEIETAPSSGVFEKYACVFSGDFNTTNLGIDGRSKFCETLPDGTIRIGSNGVDDVGFLPVVGCIVRIPNVIGRQCETTSRAVNASPHTTIASRPELVLSASGIINSNSFICDWYLNLNGAFKVTLKNFFTFDTIIMSVLSQSTLNNICISVTGATIAISFNTGLSTSIITITDALVVQYSNKYAFRYASPSELLLDNVSFISFKKRTYSVVLVYISYSNNITMNNCFATNGTTQITGCQYVTINGYDYCDRLVGTVDATYPLRCFLIQNVNDLIINNFSFGRIGEFPSQNNCNQDILYFSGCNGVFFHDFGTRENPLLADETYKPARFLQNVGSYNVTARRIYIQNCARAFVSLTVSSSGMTFENCYSDSTERILIENNNLKMHGCYFPTNVIARNSIYGTHFRDNFYSDTQGDLILGLNEPSEETENLSTLSLSTDSGGFTAGGSLALNIVGDYFEIEMDYYALGYLSFSNINPSIVASGVANLSFEYQIDVNDGNGFSAYKTLNAANLSSEIISQSLGFKLKYKITCISSGSNTVTSMLLYLTTSLQAQIDNIYQDPLESINATVDVLSGSRVQLYNVTTATEIDNTISASGTYIQAVAANSGDILRMRVTLLGYEPIETFAEFSGVNVGFVASQELDEVYQINGIDGSTMTQYSYDSGNIQIDINDADGETTLQEFWAWYNYFMTTEIGINLVGGFTALDEVNYRINTDLFTFQFENINPLPVRISGGYIYRSDGDLMLADTGNSILMEPAKAYIVNSAQLARKTDIYPLY